MRRWHSRTVHRQTDNTKHHITSLFQAFKKAKIGGKEVVASTQIDSLIN